MNDSGKSLELRLVGADAQNGDVLFSDFRTFCDNLARCLRQAELEVSGKYEGKFYVADLKHSSAFIAVAPMLGYKNGDKALERIADSVGCLERGTIKGIKAGRDLLQSIRDLFEVVGKKKRVKGAFINGREVTTQTIATIDRILGETIVSYGSVSGKFERLNIHKTYEFVIYPPVTGQTVRCEFIPEMFEEIRKCIGKSVTVYGKVYRNPDSQFPDRVHVQKIVVKSDSARLPKLSELRGISKGCTDGMSVRDFVGALRR